LSGICKEKINPKAFGNIAFSKYLMHARITGRHYTEKGNLTINVF